ncbi:nucleotide exchange factor GrpE [Planctomycetota bacterium]
MKQKQDDKVKSQEKSKKKSKDELDDLRSRIESLQQEKAELFGKLQRVSADYSNFQKRVPKQIADSIAYEKEMIIKSLLGVLDNFEHTLQTGGNSDNIDKLVKGVEIIYRQMLDILRSYGVGQIKALGEQFNPALHQAMMQRSEQQKQEGIILEEFQKGYTLNGRVIRPNKVVVNKLVSEEKEVESSSEEETEKSVQQEAQRPDELTEQQDKPNEQE